jgi:hypothetical protein
MQIPTFNAEASLYKSGNQYHSRGAGIDGTAAIIIPAIVSGYLTICNSLLPGVFFCIHLQPLPVGVEGF